MPATKPFGIVPDPIANHFSPVFMPCLSPCQHFQRCCSAGTHRNGGRWSPHFSTPFMFWQLLEELSCPPLPPGPYSPGCWRARFESTRASLPCLCEEERVSLSCCWRWLMLTSLISTGTGQWTRSYQIGYCVLAARVSNSLEGLNYTPRPHLTKGRFVPIGPALFN